MAVDIYDEVVFIASVEAPVDDSRRDLTHRLNDASRMTSARLVRDTRRAGVELEPEIAECQHTFFTVKHREGVNSKFNWKSESKLKEFQARVFGVSSE